MMTLSIENIHTQTSEMLLMLLALSIYLGLYSLRFLVLSGVVLITFDAAHPSLGALFEVRLGNFIIFPLQLSHLLLHLFISCFFNLVLSGHLLVDIFHLLINCLDKVYCLLMSYRFVSRLDTSDRLMEVN